MADIRDDSKKRGLEAPEREGQGESPSPEQAGPGAQGDEPEVETIELESPAGLKVTLELEIPARLQVTGPKLKRRGKGAGLSGQQARDVWREVARETARRLQAERPEFLEELRQAFAEAEQEGQRPRLTRLSYQPQKDHEGLDPDGYENLEFYGDFLTQEELAEIAQVLREQRMMHPLPEDPEQVKAELQAYEERHQRKDP
ncbi:hypothetical protein [Meiothermus taiwanensis]|jgi:hypothetical protein|uniref:Uncharacterized protein n=1 Tax=Meiothermus taiwanensis WR-220 TaxID=1339250 RepID=A0ABM6WJ82_9DEIN|nr:hypothetical protein [Meiothermus taiwanensis]AWR87069.1 hypothetical protein Mtai_v1c18350 [Meiothermus taiwanensis WR-220]KIQ55436.1 hypothetical protein SY28_03355 [Meiothermus taiwanensis]KZK16139.1 hypothetical protein A3962_07540 [Meiothermus taiwanensis]